MTRLHPLALLALASLAHAQDPTPEPPAATTYALSPGQSDVYVVIRNDPEAMLQRLGHDHVIYASSFTGTVTWPNVDGGACAVSISVPVTALTVDPPGLREKAGLDDRSIDDTDKGKLSKNMWGSGQLDASRFPQATFEATRCSGRSGMVEVTGNMTVRGVTKPVTLSMDVNADGRTFSASGRFESSHTQWGFSPFAGSALGPRNQDRLSFVVRVRGAAR